MTETEFQQQILRNLETLNTSAGNLKQKIDNLEQGQERLQQRQ